MVLSASPLLPAAITSRLSQIASELCQDANLLRIKKLLFYVCTENWETDQQRLERLSLSVLLQHLLESSPSFEAFQQKINQAAASLNKSAEYRIVAHAVISRFSVVYAELHQEQVAATGQEVYWTVMHQLQTLMPAAEDQRRVKKLMLLTCRGSWETEASRLEELSLSALVRELHQVAPTAASLSATLTQVAQALNKPAVYSQLADRISLAFQPLYDSAITASVTASVTELRCASAEAAVLPFAPPEPAVRGTNLTATNPTAADLSAAAIPSQLNTAEQPTRTMLRVVQPARSASPAARPAQSATRRVKKPADLRADLFDLRLEIMQDSNPYRIKILLFSLLHEPFQPDADHEALLRTHELDELLHGLFLSYRQYAELDGKLRQTAIALAKEEYLQPAEALLRAVLPYYMAAPAVDLPADLPVDLQIAEPQAQTALTEVTGMRANSPEITLPD
ncbi:MAG: hypothetical protein KME07_21480 [Pegethrix bostrychoides GSE-TBD4-15B]|jgi:hypothetical protein|uniref:Uncharacterized protein n=1 Tax=Pegethrix bostrychoides GSE-TBD4-15B TaxID=2839662 RepID=A0A951PFE5_9CYAN|nr:hypothetical protein [Pegethrix bostrychoides GSE-TBD4-15B]